MKEDLKKLWDRIEYLMEINGITGSYMDREMGIHNFLQRRGTNISMTTLFKISNILGYPLGEFFSEDVAPTSSKPIGNRECYVVTKTIPTGATETYRVFDNENEAWRKVNSLGAVQTFDKYPNKFLNPLTGYWYTIKKSRYEYTS